MGPISSSTFSFFNLLPLYTCEPPTGAAHWCRARREEPARADAMTYYRCCTRRSRPPRRGGRRRGHRHYPSLAPGFDWSAVEPPTGAMPGAHARRDEETMVAGVTMTYRWHQDLERCGASRGPCRRELVLPGGFAPRNQCCPGTCCVASCRCCPGHPHPSGVGCCLVRTMCRSRTGGWSLPCVMSD
jgi:hypothetical protein